MGYASEEVNPADDENDSAEAFAEVIDLRPSVPAQRPEGDVWSTGLNSDMLGPEAGAQGVPGVLDAGGPGAQRARLERALSAGMPPVGVWASQAEALRKAAVADEEGALWAFFDEWRHDRDKLRETCEFAGLAEAHTGYVLGTWDLRESKIKAEGAEAAAPDSLVDRFESMSLDMDGMFSQEPARPLVHGLLELDSLARLVGASNTGKSFVALSVALSVARGREWFGHRTHRGPVVYLAAEGARGMGKRYRAICQDQGITEDPGIVFMPSAVQMLDRDEWPAFVQWCTRKEPVLVVIDTQARVTVGVDENSNTEAGLVVAAADALRTATGACVLLVHHTGHGQDRARGASAGTAALDTELLLEPKVIKGSEVADAGDPFDNEADTRGSVKAMRLKVTKQKDDGFAAPKLLRLETVLLDGLADEMGFPVKSAVVREIPLDGGGPRSGTEDRVDEIVALLDKWGVDYVSQRASREALKIRMEAGGEEVPKFRNTDFQTAVTRRNERRKYESGEVPV